MVCDVGIWRLAGCSGGEVRVHYSTSEMWGGEVVMVTPAVGYVYMGKRRPKPPYLGGDREAHIAEQ